MTRSMEHGPAVRDEPKVGDLVRQASEQLSELVRGEIQLAKAELAVKGKNAGVGGGLFAGAGVVAFVAFQAMAAAAIAGIALALSVWAAGLIVGGVLAAVAGVLAMLGKKRVGRSMPPAPQQTIDSVKADVEEIKERAARH